MLNLAPAKNLLNNHFVNPPTDLSINWNPPQIKSSAFNVPRSIHYVWVGEKRIPDSALRNIYRMHQVNCSPKSLDSFKIFVWTNNPKKISDAMYNAEKSDDLILRQLAINNNKDSKITTKDYSVLFTCEENKNIVDHKVKLYLEGLVIRNLYGPFKNYACASDILRLFALNLGGIYLDVDVAVIDKIPESYLTNEHGFKIHGEKSIKRIFANYMIAAPHNWLIENLLMLMCVQHVAYDRPKGYECSSTNEQLNVTWHQQRSLQEYIAPNNIKYNLRKNLTLSLTGPNLYSKACTYIYKNYINVCMRESESEIHREYFIRKGVFYLMGINGLLAWSESDEESLYHLGRKLTLAEKCPIEDFLCSRYYFASEIFNNHEDPQEYAKSPEAHKPFFAHGVIKGIAPHGDMEDNLDSWCKVDMNAKAHDTSDIPV